MSSFIINVTNTSGDTGTILSDVGFSYTDNLNDLNEGQLRVTGTGESRRALFEIGSVVSIYKNGTLEFYGIINAMSNLNAGGIAADLKGYEVFMGKENGAYANSPWKATASATIAAAIIAESSYFTGGTIEAGADIDFKAETASSLWNALASLNKITGQDIGIDYTNLEIDILDHKGSTTSVATLNDGLQIQDLTLRQTYPIGNDVRVYGKGNGTDQITSALTSGQDATSKSTYGTIQKDHLDSSILSVTQANTLADKLVAKYKDPVKIYEFNLINTGLTLVAGDVITLNAKTKGLSNEEVRVVGIERGMRDNQEFMKLQVTNKAYSEKQRSVEKQIAINQKIASDKQTYMQGTTNILTFSEMINADSSAPLRVISYLSSDFIEDEAGNLRVDSLTFDYDVDPFRRGVGSASEDDVAPGVAGSSANTQPGVSGTSAETETFDQVDTDSFTTVSCSSGGWTTLGTISYGTGLPTGERLFGGIFIEETSGGPEDVLIQMENNQTGDVFLGFARGFDNTISDFAIDNIDAGQWSSSAGQVRLRAYPITGSITLSGTLSLGVTSHDHADGSYTAANHLHADGTYAAASHNHSVSVGDTISDAGSLNATEVNLYLDFWNGSAWVNKHSVTSTGKTIDSDVDISDSGTYPDAAGYWRVRVLTDSASADLVQGTIKCKHALDT